MNVRDALNSEVGFGLGREASVSGLIVVSDAVTYLCASETEHQKAILVIAPWLGSELLNEVSVSVGSMHLFSSPATVTGQLVTSGLGLLPLAFYRVSKISVFIEGRVVELLA